MFNSLINKIVYFLFILTIIIFSSCDGRDKTHVKSLQILEDKNRLTSFAERIKYFPEHYSETITDTILSTGYTIRVKTFVDMKTNILTSNAHTSYNTKILYRNANANVLVTLDDKILFNETISKGFIQHHRNDTSKLLDSYILKSIWIDDSQDFSKDSVIFNIFYSKPEDASINKSFLLTISKQGDFKITETTTKI
ncbi:conserved hypothetical protein [Formosa agariphila KMM 3901]|uniref:Uncharacterized protein n=1 Tax=Formosa agariphila (strain DSM 15362 / KCTC 12365 / LMG 23005 / KMM 3901 / M-2Alg 35-1) TaxID=1347342 RepID=T2KL31_FORAG|nr:hypothetical protein [Formosa agariphila]CDF79148.1 conserved hypothetical protein [Formosa agariphila KMM 3901]